MHFFKSTLTAFIVLALSSILVHAHEIEKGTLFIIDPNIPQPAKGAPVSAGYMEIHNTGEEEEILIGVSSDFSERSEIHTVEIVDDVAKMRPVKDGISIPAGGKVKLKRGGIHLMFMKMTEQLEEGQLKEVVLTFKNAGDLPIKMLVEKQSAGHGGHGDHSNHSDHSSHSGHSGHSDHSEHKHN